MPKKIRLIFSATEVFCVCSICVAFFEHVTKWYKTNVEHYDLNNQYYFQPSITKKSLKLQ